MRLARRVLGDVDHRRRAPRPGGAARRDGPLPRLRRARPRGRPRAGGRRRAGRRARPAACSRRATTTRWRPSWPSCSAATCRRRSSTPGAAADDFRVRFQQTCGPVMAKGIEDTAYYRWFRLAGANEVGGHPDHPAITADEFHAWCERQVTTLADVDDDADDPRHEALRGRARPAHGARRGRRGLGDAGSRRPGAHRGAPPRRARRRPHRVPRLADPRRHLADHRRAAGGVPPQGGARGEGAHGVGRRRRRATRTRSSPTAVRCSTTRRCRRTSTRGRSRTSRRCGPTSSPRSWSS